MAQQHRLRTARSNLRVRSRDRWELLWTGLFAATLALPTVLAVAEADSASEAALPIGVACAFGAWHWLLAVRHPDWEERWPMALWFAGALGFTWVLIGIDGNYLMVIYGLYPQVFGLLGRGAIPGAVALTAMVFWRIGLLSEGGIRTVLTVAGSTLLAVMIGVFVRALARQSEERKRALDELDATRAELAATSRRAGIFEERERLAREIHDAVAQGFTGIVMQLEAADQALEADPAAAQEHLARARRSARDSLGELRRTVRALRPELLEDAALGEAVDRVARRWSEQTGVPVRLLGGTVPSARPEAEVALLRIAQEALANVARHADAHSVTVTLAGTGDDLVLEVADDGSGFLPEAEHPERLGLRGMRERVAELGGRLTVASAPGEGTRIEARVPAEAAPEADRNGAAPRLPIASEAPTVPQPPEAPAAGSGRRP